MIDERFLIAAVNIRRKYLKLSSNLDLYRDKAEDTLEELQKAKEKLTKIEKGDYDKENLSGLQEILNIIVGLEDSQRSFEKTLEPLNKEIEKLEYIITRDGIKPHMIKFVKNIPTMVKIK